MKRNFSTRINLNSLTQVLFKRSLLSLVFLASVILGRAQNISIIPGGNPASVVVMGDSLVFSPGVISDATISNAELEVEVPAGFELLVSTPDFKPGSLSNDKRTGRILIASLTQNTTLTLTVYVKALCDAETATPLADRKIKYSFYLSASAPSPLAVVSIANGIQNFNSPTLNITYPASDVVPMRSSNTRTFTVVQTRNYSHVNYLHVTVQCDPAGLDISKVEVRRNDGEPWTEIQVEKNNTGYRYIIKRDEFFSAANGYPNRQLGYNDTLLIQETVSLLQCDKGSANYSFAYGDSVTFCSPAASTGNVTYSQPVYSYNPDIYQPVFYNPGGPASDGRYVTCVLNNSTQAEATMHDLYVSLDDMSNYVVRSAYFTDASGTPILNGADTVFIPIVNSRVMFDNLNNSALAAYYEARGLRNLDGDGRYGDLPKGNSFHFAVKYNYVLNTGTCPAGIVSSTTRVFRLYYKTFCKGSYQNYARNYRIGEANNASTNAWQGYIMFSSIRNVAVAPTSLQTNGQARISGSLYYDGNGSVASTRGTNLYNLVMSGVSRYFSTIVLPKGLSFDNTQADPVRIGNTLTSITPASYTVSPGLDTIRIQWTANWGGNNYGFNIAVKNNGTVDNSKTINIYHEYDYGNTGVLQKFGCVNALVSYLQLVPCQYLGITSLNIERRSFGYTDISKATRVTDPEDARNRGFNMKIVSPFDDMDVEGKFKAAQNISTGSRNNIRIIFSYVYDNATALFDPVSGSANGISLYYNDSNTPIQIPSSAMTKAWAIGTKTQSITFDVASYLNAAGISALNKDDSLKIVMHLRATTILPATGVDVYAQMQPVTVIDGVTHECSPLIDAVRIWNSDWGNKTSCSGGIAPCIDNYYHYSTYNTSALNFTISWSTGQADVWGSEYRPNGDNFSDLTVRYPNLLKINSVSAMVSATIKGNMTNRTLTPSTEYSVSYSGGATYLTIKKDVITNWMSSLDYSGFGYSINFDMINPTAAYLRSDLSYIYAYSYSLSFDNYPTSAAPRRDTFTNAFSSFRANGGMFDYPYKYELTPIPVNATPTGTRAEWTVRITNQSAFIANNHNLPHSWLAVECPPGVVPVELRDASTNTPVSASFVNYASGVVDKYWIKIGTIAANPVAEYILSCTYTICTGTPQLTLKYGMSKVDYPTNPDDGYSNYGSPGKLAGVVSTNISYTPPAIKFAGHLSHSPNAANNTNMFCDSVRFEGEYSNGLATNVGRLQLRVTMPPGTSYYPAYTPEVKFGNGGWVNVASVDESPGELLITLDDSKELLAFGSPNSGDRAYVRYALKISCGVENGMQFPAEFIGHSGCGTAVSEHRVDVAPLKIFGLSPPPEYWSQNLSLTPADASAPYIYTGNTAPVNGEMKLSGRYILTADAENNVIAIIDLPPNLKMTGQDNSDLSFIQEGSSLIADLQGSGSSGAQYNFGNIRLVPENPELWTEDSVTIYIRTGKKFDLICNSQPCVVTDKITLDSIKFAFKKLDIRFSDSIAARSRLSSSTEEHVEIKGWLANDELTATFNSLFNAGELAMELLYFDGMSYTPAGGATVTGLTVNSITHRDSTQFTVEADIPYTNVCSLLLVLRRAGAGASNPYISDSVAIAVPSPRYEITTQPLPVCQMAVNTSIGEPAITGYTYQWTPATYLSAGGAGTPLDFNYDYRTNPLPDGGVLQYLVSVTRPQGCSSVDTVFVRLKGIPAVEPVADVVVCPGNGLAVNFADNTGSGSPVTEFHWTVEALTGDISGTGLPSSDTGDINVPSLVNATGASIVAKCIVRPEKDGCYGLADTFDIKILPASILDYPDIRLNVCPGTTVNLSKYIDTVEYPDIVWKNVSGLPVSAAGEVVIAGSSQPGTYTFTYEATNRCVATPLVRKAYLRILSGNVRWQRNTITICHEKAEALQINQIFGIEAGGTFEYAADDDSDISLYIKTSSTYGGAITMDGKAIYKETSARQVTITYTPANDSCLAGRIFSIKIILTE